MIPAPGAVIPDPTPKKAVDPGSHIPCYDPVVKIKDRSSERSHKVDGIGFGRMRTFPFSSDSAYSDSVAYDPVKTRLSESEAEAKEPTNYNA